MTVQLERAIVLTGAASGIGAAVARALAGPGTALLLHTRRNESGLSAVARDCRAAGAEVETVLGDLSDTAFSAGLPGQAKAAFGRLDQIVNNAGAALRKPFGEFSQDELAQALAVMPVAFSAMVTSALPDLEASDWGRVVIVSSFVAHVHGKAGTLFPTTTAAKAALEGLMRALAWQLGPTGTTVNAVVPGFTRKEGGGHLAVTSDMLTRAMAETPTGRLCEPQDIAAAVRFLLSREARQITGQALHVDGGLTLG